MPLNIRKVAVQLVEYQSKIIKKDDFYIISIEIAFLNYPRILCLR